MKNKEVIEAGIEWLNNLILSPEEHCESFKLKFALFELEDLEDSEKNEFFNLLAELTEKEINEYGNCVWKKIYNCEGILEEALSSTNISDIIIPDYLYVELDRYNVVAKYGYYGDKKVIFDRLNQNSKNR